MSQIKGYKLVRVRKDGSLGPLFINTRFRIPMRQWLRAEAHYTPGFAFRPGWHVTAKPWAPHLSKKGRVWAEVLIEDYQEIHRPERQGGLWYLAWRIYFVDTLTEAQVARLTTDSTCARLPA